MIKFFTSLGVIVGFCYSTATAGAQAPLKVTPIPGATGSPPAIAAPPVPSAPSLQPVQPVPQTVPVPAVKPAEAATYVVKAGDNPWTIAKNHGISLDALLKANKIKDPKNLNVGDVLVLPAGVASKGSPAPVAAPATPAPAPSAISAPGAGDNWEVYTIKKGDNPWNIAKRLKVDHQKIISLNEGLDFTKLSIGQQIKVPKKP
ncbi:MAG: LysM peptidoglycan-binding domain-containing protein [Verrucomicrobiales bacterium]|nr:LysM peptidoglycan-binding domain-containing protein [Verrucomicrobiales bacterium]